MDNMKKIMIIDDAGFIRVLFREALKREGYEVITCENTYTAYKMIKESEPDLLLLDINLPGGSGIDLLKQLRNEGNNISVIMITAVSIKDTVIEASKYGIKSYLTKPVDINILKERISEALEE